MKVLRESSPQALHHFTRFDQVDQLVRASEAAPDTGFMARLMTLHRKTLEQWPRVEVPATSSARRRESSVELRGPRREERCLF